MILRSLELKHFGKFGDRSFEFRRGFNLVVGANESGKSTMMEAIPATLFGLRNKDRYKPWGRQGTCETALALENGGCTVRIERELLSDRVQLVERDDMYQLLYQFDGKAAPQGRSSERAEYLDQLTRLLAVADEDIFRSSLFFGQGDLELADRNGLTTRLKALLTGFVEVDYDQIAGLAGGGLFQYHP
ncbi:MAG: ATP-binding protein [Syntrophotaleaceae bacterium]